MMLPTSLPQITLLGAVIAWPVIAAAVTPVRAPPPGGEVVVDPEAPPTSGTKPAWRSAAHIAAVDELRGKIVGGAGSAVTCYGVLRGLLARPERNLAWPNYPRLTNAETKAIVETMIAALKKGVTALYPGAGTDDALRGAFVLGTASEEGSLAALVPAYTWAWLDGLTVEDENPPWGIKLTPLGKAARRVFLARAQLAKFPTNQGGGFLGFIWKDIAYLAEWMDSVGAPVGGESWDGGVWESIRAGVQEAEGTIGNVLGGVAVFGAGVLGDAAWGVIASPVGAVLFLGGLYLVLR